MKFEEAFDIAFEKERQRAIMMGSTGFAVSPRTAKTLTFLWNMVAAAENVLDDFAFIKENNGEFTIASIPIDTTEKSVKKGKRQKPDSTVVNAPDEGGSGEEEEPETTESSNE